MVIVTGQPGPVVGPSCRCTPTAGAWKASAPWLPAAGRGREGGARARICSLQRNGETGTGLGGGEERKKEKEGGKKKSTCRKLGPGPCC